MLDTIPRTTGLREDLDDGWEFDVYAMRRTWPASCQDWPDPSDWQWWCQRSPGAESECSPNAATLPSIAEWLGMAAAWHRGQAEGDDDSDLHAYIAGELRALAGIFRNATFTTVAGFLASRRDFHSDSVDLDALKVPEARHTSTLAEEFDALAGRYLEMGSELGRFVAWNLLGLAEQAEAFGSETIGDFGDDVSAMFEAMATVEQENPLW